MVKKLLLISLCFISCPVTAQISSKKLKENIISTDEVLYIGKSNIVIVKASKGSWRNDSVTISEGYIEPRDTLETNFRIYGAAVYSTGIAIINVYKEINGKKILVESKKVKKQLLPPKERQRIAALDSRPLITFPGIKPGIFKIPFNEIKKITEVEISDPYKISSLTFYFSGANGSDVTPYALIGNKFDQTLLELWKKLLPGSMVTISDVKIIDNAGKIYEANGRSFIVTGD